MGFVLLGVLLLGLHFAGVGPPAAWSFELTGDLWKFVTPFAAALIYWWVLDASGITRRREMKKEQAQVDERRARAQAALARPGKR